MQITFAPACAGLILLLTYSQISSAEPSSAQTSQLRPFTTDGCSMWIDGPPQQPYLWRSCCVAHDKAYWMGGSNLERNQADETLRACVSKVGGSGMGNYMFFFVSTGGSPFWLTPYRWGYGWDYLDDGKPRGYKLRTPAEDEQLKALLPQAEEVIAADAIKHPSNSTRLTGN
jgi:hypothetical protein